MPPELSRIANSGGDGLLKFPGKFNMINICFVLVKEGCNYV